MREAMNQTFKPTARANAVALPMAVTMAAFSLSVGMLKGVIAFQLIAVVIVAAILLIRFRVNVTVSSEIVSVSGVFMSQEIRFEEVVSVSWPGKKGSDFSGPSVCVLRAPDHQVRINFKFFGLECMQAVMSQIPDEIK